MKNIRISEKSKELTKMQWNLIVEPFLKHYPKAPHSVCTLVSYLNFRRPENQFLLHFSINLFWKFLQNFLQQSLMLRFSALFSGKFAISLTTSLQGQNLAIKTLMGGLKIFTPPEVDKETPCINSFPYWLIISNSGPQNLKNGGGKILRKKYPNLWTKEAVKEN